jgi:hypothetical protein
VSEIESKGGAGMKITLESTAKIVEFNGLPARIWEGKTEGGIACHAFITRIAVANPSYKIIPPDKHPVPRPVAAINRETGDYYTGIVCLLCNRISYNPNDVEKKYCGNCHVFHDQVHAQFEAELQETRAPQTAAIEAYPLRMIL